MKKKYRVYVKTVTILAILFMTSFAYGTVKKIEFEYFVYPGAVAVNSSGTLEMCMMSKNSHPIDVTKFVEQILITVKIGERHSDLISDAAGVSCSTQDESWTCDSIAVSENSVVFAIQPQGRNVILDSNATVSFWLDGLEFNSSEGLSIVTIKRRIKKVHFNTGYEQAVSIYKYVPSVPSEPDEDSANIKTERPNYLSKFDGVNIVDSVSVYEDPQGRVGIGTIEPVRSLHIADAMKLEPIEAPPSDPSSGDIYFNASEALCVFVDNAWTKIAGNGVCSDDSNSNGEPDPGGGGAGTCVDLTPHMNWCNESVVTSSACYGECSDLSGGQGGWRAFCDTNNTKDKFYGNGANQGGAWLRYDFGVDNAKRITTYILQIPDEMPYSVNRAPKDWAFQASNDGVRWVTLDSRSGMLWSNFEQKSFSFNNNSPYRYYKIVISATVSGGDETNIFKMEMMTCD